MCWFTGYIFDTFDELVQMFYARKDLTQYYCCCAFHLCLPFKGRVQAASQ